MSKPQYCRACGENKGHSFMACKNASGMRDIIMSQDDEIEELQGRVETLYTNSQAAENLQQQLDFTARVLAVLVANAELLIKAASK